VVTWSKYFDGQFEYFASRWLALAAAPSDGRPFIVIDAATPVLPDLPTVWEIISNTGRPMLEVPYPNSDTRARTKSRVPGWAL
jgi:hypothetical protein